MLDENLPSFLIKPSSSGNSLNTPIFFRENGSEPRPTYNLRKPDPKLPIAKNCYALALCDSYNLGILYAEVLVKPEWTQPTLTTPEVRVQNGIPLPPVPTVPDSFVIQLHNPDHQVIVKQKAGTWNNSAYWKFEMPENSFRIPSSSVLDQTQNAPAVSDLTPKIAFKWKRDGKLSRDIACYMMGKNTDEKKRKEPDITVAVFKSGKGLTLYEPNLRRIEMEDLKGLEVVLLLSAVVIKDIFFNATREIFNMVSPKEATSEMKSNPNPPEVSRPTNSVSTNACANTLLPNSKPTLASPIVNPSALSTHSNGRLSKKEVDRETERLKKIFAAEERLQKQTEKDEKRVREMLKAEEKERRRRNAEADKETERLRREYMTLPVENFNGSNKNSTLEPRICKLTSKAIPTVLRVAPVVNGWLDPSGRRDQKSCHNHRPQSSSSNTPSGIGLVTAIKKVQRKGSYYL